MSTQLQLRISNAVTDIERKLLAELYTVGTKGHDLNEWEASFIADLHLKVESGEESHLSHKQRFYLWRAARDAFASLQSPDLQQTVEQILPVWESSYNVGSRSR